MEDLAVIIALNHSFLSEIIPLSLGENRNVIHQPKSVPVWKNCALCLEYRPRLTLALGHSFSQYGPPGWRITYIYIVSRAGYLHRANNHSIFLFTHEDNCRHGNRLIKMVVFFFPRRVLFSSFFCKHCFGLDQLTVGGKRFAFGAVTSEHSS